MASSSPFQPLSQTLSQALYVNPATGRDDASGSQSAPYRTITRALRRATAGTVIQLAAGTYSTKTGETFPLVVGAGITVVGDPASKGDRLIIEGGGDYLSPTFARQSVTLRLEDKAELRGVTVINPQPQGTGVWLEGATGANPAARVAQCTFTRCGQGIVATGSALPEIADCMFQQNTVSGISLSRNAKGELLRNLCQQTATGITLSDNTAPLLVGNRLVQNRVGIVISGNARPVLRNNVVERNGEDGLVTVGNAAPDLGKPQDPGGNVFHNNGAADVRNSTSAVLASVGNQINPTRVNLGALPSAKGLEFIASTVAEQIRPISPPQPQPRPVPTPPLPPVPIPETGLTDISGHWAEAFIAALVERSIIGGFPDRTFKPDLLLTRAQFATILTRTFDLPAVRSPSSFVDVAPDFWATAAIARAVEMGFLAGFPDGTFRPNVNLTRVQAILALVNGLGLTGGHPGHLGVYRDRAQIPTYATIPIATATQKRLIVNHPQVELLRPMSDITRAEVSAILYQALVITAQARAIPSPYIVVPDTVAVAFSDTTRHWAADFIQGLVSQGVVSGFSDGTFRPEAGMSRAQYAALLVNTFNPLPRRPALEFTDVPTTHWAYRAIQQAYRGKLLSGVGENQFRPDQNVRRIEVLLSLVNGLGLPPGNPLLLNRYADRDTLPTFAQPAVASATGQRLVVNYPDLNRLEPVREATRAEVTAMVYQALVQARRSPAIFSPYIVEPEVAAQSAMAPAASSVGQSSPPGSHPAGRPEDLPMVILDPGHGGADPGVVVGEVQEKELTLAIALDIAKLLQDYGVQPHLTRTDDRTVSLGDRLAILQQTQPAPSALISLHLNATRPPRPAVNGLETYHLPNAAESRRLAQSIHTNIVQTLEMGDRGIRTASFALLRPPIPAVHLELGYLTGETDVANLTSPDYRQRLGKAIALAVVQFVRQTVG
ncbi:S-layer homology domain-containing protein [Thermoleptolyngbya sichuanensis XZ-Cy5]|uniref:S-layer homology domain-containing protein n=1 Tax=Thermoleptolyngbya sichuanensis TaxID=2885951 RepID=UPI00240E28B0|nr:S-layer homology domain-containing protein [Thermoleptolyngbya sichuanensis]MDG2615050.1 S-layer homology domain-containing protein [Thermoleptolyngbya sichuanensis XZ-Cy5]